MRTATVVVIALIGALIGTAAAQAAPGCEPGAPECPPLLNQFGEWGTGAGQVQVPVGLAADPDTGHVFAVDGFQGRINEFDSNGNFIKAWGWGVRDGTAEPQVCTAATGCQAGVEGEGAGQFRQAAEPAVDQEGNIWVADVGRLQKFSPSGQFLLMLGGEVNKTKVQEREAQEANGEPVTVTEAEENLCTAASGDVCGAATGGTGQGKFLSPSLAAGPDGTVYVGDDDRIQKFDEEGNYEGEIPLPGAGSTQALAIGTDGRIYVVSSEVTHLVFLSNGQPAFSPVVREVGPAGEELGRLTAEWDGHEMPQNPSQLAVDAEGNVYANGTVIYQLPGPEGAPPEFETLSEVVAFDSEGELISFEPDKAGIGASTDSTRAGGLATNVVGDGSGAPGEVIVGHFPRFKPGELFNAYIRSYGVPFERKTRPPEVEDDWVASVGAADATREALIKPGFATDATLQVEYGTGTCSAGGCGSLAPASPTPLGGTGGNAAVATGPVSLVGLQPSTTYHYRFLAENEVTDEEGSGPVHGPEGTFRTFALPGVAKGCANDLLRVGASAPLPDCRAYEMVSPPDKEGGQIFLPSNITGYASGIEQSSTSGDTLAYISGQAFAAPGASPYVSQYLARRDTGGWSTEPISPPHGTPLPAPSLDGEYKAFDEDLSTSWLVPDSEPTLTEDALAGYRNLYRRDSQTGAYRAECPVTPAVIGAGGFRLEPQGYSADGSHLVFRATDALTFDAVPGLEQVYECVEGEDLRLVGVLPNGEVSAAGSTAGTAEGGFGGGGLRLNSVAGAVSDDGSRIFWTAKANGPAPLYVRIDGEETMQIASGSARFRTAAADGGRVLYTVGTDLFEASVGDESVSSALVAGDFVGFMGASEDAKLVYFASREDLDGAGEAKAGDPNLYLYRSDADAYTLIGALSQGDANESEVISGASLPVLRPFSISPFHRSARVTADGLHAAFAARTPLTGYDNTDQKSGEADTEVFLYDASTDELLCVSCNPSGSRPRGGNVGSDALPYWVGATIPGWKSALYASRALREDGSRVYFEAVDPLVLADTNGVQDVYQWEASGTGTCTAASTTYSPDSQGCIDLISSGKSPDPSEFADASPDGRDVFFRTTASLFPTDPGLRDIYDAREGGGFAPPPTPKPPCEGEACQPAVVPPPLQTPASATFRGSGNAPRSARKRKRCARNGASKAKARATKAGCSKGRKKQRTRHDQRLRRNGR